MASRDSNRQVAAYELRLKGIATDAIRQRLGFVSLVATRRAISRGKGIVAARLLTVLDPQDG